jgi:hypothetical protein
MPTTTTTTTATDGSGATTTTTTTTTTMAEAIPPASATAAAAASTPTAGVRPPVDEAAVTPEWLTAALHERGHLPRSVKVRSIEPLTNIGEGRGYANYSWKIVCTYDKPVAPDIPTKFVLKQLNQTFAPNWDKGRMRELADKSYCLEATWYEEIRDLLPVPQPKLYWSGCESPANPSEDMGVYGVLMEWLGDDLKKVETQDGITEEECVQCMEGLARLHAAFWNTDTPGQLAACFTPEESLEMIRGFMGGKEPAVKYAQNELTQEFGAKFGAYATAAVDSMESWDFKGCTGSANKTLCTWDFRTDNVVFRKTPGGAAEYEAVIIDHQIWSYGGGPMFDVAVFFGCSCTCEQMEARVAVGLKAYHDQLVQCGVSTYSFDECNTDFDTAIWHAVCFPCFAGKILDGLRTQVAAAEDGSAAETEAKAMVANLTQIFGDMAKRSKTLVELRDAYTSAPFTVAGDFEVAN